MNIRSVVQIPALAMCLACAGADAFELHYQGYIAGMKAGTAKVTVEVVDGEYRVAGNVKTKGFWNKIAPWRAIFSAQGKFEDGRADPSRFDYTEASPKKHRTVKVVDGTLEQVKNGERRPDRDAHEGIDVVSAIWITSICDQDLRLHNGRHFFVLSRTEWNFEDDAEVCHYDIVDDDGDHAKGRIRLETRLGHRVPVKIELRDGLRSTLKLVDISPTPAEGADFTSTEVALAD